MKRKEPRIFLTFGLFWLSSVQENKRSNFKFYFFSTQILLFFLHDALFEREGKNLRNNSLLEQKVLKKTFFINHFEKKLYIYFWKSGYGSRGFRNSITPMFCWWWPQQFTINKLCFKSIFKVLIISNINNILT